MSIIRTTGNAKPHIVHHGYQNQSRHSSRWADVRRHFHLDTFLRAYCIVLTIGVVWYAFS